MLDLNNHQKAKLAEEIFQNIKGSDVLAYISSARKKFSKEFEKIQGYEPSFIQHLSIDVMQSVFPRLSPSSQAYAMPVTNAALAIATMNLVEGMEHLHSHNPPDYQEAARRAYEVDRTIFTIEHPLSYGRLSKIDAPFANEMRYDDPHTHGCVDLFISQIRNAPDDRSKSYLAGCAQMISTLRLPSRSSDFDAWMLSIPFSPVSAVK